MAPICAGIAWINAWPKPDDLRKHREFDFYWKGAYAAADKFGYRLEEFQLGRDMSPHRLHQILSTRGIRGLLLPPHHIVPDWKDFPWSEYSVVRFGRSVQHPDTHLVTADQVGRRKPHPEPFLYACSMLQAAPADTVVIGDSANDAEGARAAGCRVVLVSYGYSEGRDVRELGADGVATEFGEAVSLLLD